MRTCTPLKSIQLLGQPLQVIRIHTFPIWTVIQAPTASKIEIKTHPLAFWLSRDDHRAHDLTAKGRGHFLGATAKLRRKTLMQTLTLIRTLIPKQLMTLLLPTRLPCTLASPLRVRPRFPQAELAQRQQELSVSVLGHRVHGVDLDEMQHWRSSWATGTCNSQKCLPLRLAAILVAMQ